MGPLIDSPWVIRGREFLNCSCASGHPSHFNGRQSRGRCFAVAGIRIDEGQHGQTDISGLSLAMIFALNEDGGKGEVLPILDEAADQAQRAALLDIVTSLDDVAGSTFFRSFSTTFAVMREPVFARIDLVVDISGRRARLEVPGLIDARGEPVLDPDNGEPQRLQLALYDGADVAAREVGRGWASVTGPMTFELRDRHAQFAPLVMTEGGAFHLPL